MTKHYCDRCDRETVKENLVVLVIPAGNGQPIDEKDICLNCLSNLQNDWFNLPQVE